MYLPCNLGGKVKNNILFNDVEILDRNSIFWVMKKTLLLQIYKSPVLTELFFMHFTVV